MEWADLFAENIGAVVGVLGALSGVGVGAVVEGKRRSADRDTAARIRAEERRVEAHERMIEVLSTSDSRISESIGRAWGHDLSDEDARAAVRTEPGSKDLVPGLLAAQARVQLHCPETHAECVEAVDAVIAFGHTRTAFAKGVDNRDRLVETGRLSEEAFHRYVLAARRDVALRDHAAPPASTRR